MSPKRCHTNSAKKRRPAVDMLFWDNPQGDKGKRFQEAVSALGWTEKQTKQYLSISSSRLAAMVHGAFDNVPGSVFVRMAEAGIDVQFVLTGRGSVPIKPDEAALLDSYRNSTPEGQASLRKTGATLEKPLTDDGDVHCA